MCHTIYCKKEWTFLIQKSEDILSYLVHHHYMKGEKLLRKVYCIRGCQTPDPLHLTDFITSEKKKNYLEWQNEGGDTLFVDARFPPNWNWLLILCSANWRELLFTWDTIQTWNLDAVWFQEAASFWVQWRKGDNAWGLDCSLKNQYAYERESGGGGNSKERDPGYASDPLGQAWINCILFYIKALNQKTDSWKTYIRSEVQSNKLIITMYSN